MRTVWAGSIVMLAAVALGLAVWAVISGYANSAASRTRLDDIEDRLTALDERVGSVAERVRTVPDWTIPVGSSLPADSGGVVPPIPPSIATAKTPAAQLHLVAWTESYCDALLALYRRDANRRTAATLARTDTGKMSHWQEALGGMAATEEIAARGAIRRAQEAKARFEEANR